MTLEFGVLNIVMLPSVRDAFKVQKREELQPIFCSWTSYYDGIEHL